MATFGAFWGQVCVFQLQTPESDAVECRLVRPTATFVCMPHDLFTRVLAMDAPSEAKQIRLAASTASSKPCL